MAQADGTILIDTEIDADGMKAGSKEVEDAVRRMAASVDDLGTKAKTALNKQVDSFVKLNQEFAAQAKKVEELKRKVAEYGNQKVPTDEYREIQTQIDQAKAKMDRLVSAQEKFIAIGGSRKSNTYKRYQYDIDELANTIKYAEGELEELENTGKAFTFGSKTKEAAADMERLAAAERKLSDMNNRLGTSYSSIKGQVNDYQKSLLKTSTAQQKASNTGKNLSKSLRSTGKSANSANFGIGKMLGTSILFSFVFQAINAAMTALADGFTNLAQYSGTTNRSISMLWSSLERLKNSLATAFAPILDVAAPILSKFIDMLSTAASYVSMFFAFLSGQSTYTRAVAVQKDYAASLEDTAGSAQDAADATNEAADAAERYLSPLDDINKYAPADTGSGKGGGGADEGGTGSGPLFEEVPIDNKFASLLDSVLEKLKEIRDIFMDGFWDGLGDYKPLLEELKSDLSSIGRYLTEIFTDADVQSAAKNFVESFAYNIGRMTGALAKVGLTIAVNVVGGIESYLSENVDRIKNYLIRMFDAGAEIMTLVGDLAESISDIFADVFGSQTAQDLTGNLIGIFAELSMLGQTLAWSFGRDIVNFFVKPIVDNKERIKTALMETLAPLESISRSIKKFVQHVADKILQLYDDHIKPFIDSLSSGVSEIVSVILDAYNKYIAPILDAWAAKFDEVLNGPIGDAVDSLINLIGKAIDALKMLWENVLVPLISWIIENVVPVLAPIIETLGNIILEFFGVVGDVLSGIFDALIGLIDAIVGVFTGDWEKAWNGVQAIFSGVWKAISAILSFVWDKIESIVKAGAYFVKDLVSGVWNQIKSFTSNVWNGIKSALSGIWNGIKNAASSIFNGIRTGINNIWGNIKSFASSVWNGIRSNLSSIWNGIKSSASSIFNGIKTTINNVWSNIKSYASSAWNGIKWTVENIWNGLKNSASNAFNGIRSIVSSVWNSIRQITSSIWNGIVGTIKSAVNGIIGGINGMIRGVVSGINSVIRALNRLSFKIPDWVPLFGGRRFGFNIGTISAPQIPYLASGAVIPPNKEFLAVLGDQKSGNNIEAPESLIRRIVREESGNSGLQRIEVPIYLNRRQIAKAVVEEGKTMRTQTGRNPFELA